MLSFTNLINLYFDPDASLSAGIEANSPMIIRAALLSGADANIGLRQALHNIEAARILIEDGIADVNMLHFTKERPSDNVETGRTVLYMAASLGLTDMVEMLIKHGALSNVRSHIRICRDIDPTPVSPSSIAPSLRIGNTALHCAVQGNHFDTVRRLLDDPHVQLDARNENGETAFEIAMRCGNVRLMGVLGKKDVIAAGASTLNAISESLSDLQENVLDLFQEQPLVVNRLRRKADDQNDTDNQRKRNRP